MNLRLLERGDFDPLVESYYLCYEERARGEPIGITLFEERPSMEAERAWFEALWKRVSEGEALCVVAEEGGRAVGSCTVSRAGPPGRSEVGHVGELGILIHRDYRRRGLGRALMVAALERCRGRFELVRLSVLATNHVARRLYRQLGFVGCGVIPRGFRRADQYTDLEILAIEIPPPEPPGGFGPGG